MRVADVFERNSLHEPKMRRRASSIAFLNNAIGPPVCSLRSWLLFLERVTRSIGAKSSSSSLSFVVIFEFCTNSFYVHKFLSLTESVTGAALEDMLI